MANLADVIVSDASETDFGGNSESARQALTEAVTAPQEPTQNTGNSEVTGTNQSAEDLPEKFRGKSPKQIVEMYQNLESRLGTMANDLGVQRQLTDRLLGMKREDDLRANDPSRKRVESKPVTTNDILDRPQETLERVVTERVSSVQEDVNTRIRTLETELARAKFETKHSNYQQTVNDPAFIEWVKASPLRMRAAAVANAGDWGIADELFTEYEQTHRQPTHQNTTRQDNSNLDEARRASFTTSGNASGTDGKAKPGKVYKRSDLMRLRIEDPEAYYDEAFQDEILRAHAEGRVK